jgi:stress response protein SCP2
MLQDSAKKVVKQAKAQNVKEVLFTVSIYMHSTFGSFPKARVSMVLPSPLDSKY